MLKIKIIKCSSHIYISTLSMMFLSRNLESSLPNFSDIFLLDIQIVNEELFKKALLDLYSYLIIYE